MSNGNRLTGNVYVDGELRSRTLIPSVGAVSNTHVAADAAIAYTKLQHLHHRQYAQPNTAAAAVTQVIHEARAAGTVLAVRTGSIAAAIGDAVVTVDIRKNGSTILSSVITLDNGNTAYVSEAGTITGTAYVAGDVFTVVVTATAGTGTLPTGLFATVLFAETAPV